MIQDSTAVNRISEVTRRDIIDCLLLRNEPFSGRLEVMEFLKRVWNFSSRPSSDVRFGSAEGDIWQHFVNWNDWTEEQLLFDHLDIVTCPDETFGKFLEMCVHPLARPNADETSALAESFNAFLRNDGFVLVQD